MSVVRKARWLRERKISRASEDGFAEWHLRWPPLRRMPYTAMCSYPNSSLRWHITPLVTGVVRGASYWQSYRTLSPAGFAPVELAALGDGSSFRKSTPGFGHKTGTGCSRSNVSVSR